MAIIHRRLHRRLHPRSFNLQIAEMNLTSQQLDHEESRKCFKREKRPARLFYVHDDEVAFIYYLCISPILYYSSFYMSLNQGLVLSASDT